MKLKLFVTADMLEDLDQRLEALIAEAEESKAKLLEISCGAISDDMRRRIVNFLNKKEIRRRYNRYEKTSSGWNRIIVHFRWDSDNCRGR